MVLMQVCKIFAFEVVDNVLWAKFFHCDYPLERLKTEAGALAYYKQYGNKFSFSQNLAWVNANRYTIVSLTLHRQSTKDNRWLHYVVEGDILYAATEQNRLEIWDLREEQKIEKKIKKIDEIPLEGHNPPIKLEKNFPYLWVVFSNGYQMFHLEGKKEAVLRPFTSWAIKTTDGSPPEPKFFATADYIAIHLGGHQVSVSDNDGNEIKSFDSHDREPVVDFHISGDIFYLLSKDGMLIWENLKSKDSEGTLDLSKESSVPESISGITKDGCAIILYRTSTILLGITEEHPALVSWDLTTGASMGGVDGWPSRRFSKLIMTNDHLIINGSIMLVYSLPTLELCSRYSSDVFPNDAEFSQRSAEWDEKDANPTLPFFKNHDRDDSRVYHPIRWNLETHDPTLAVMEFLPSKKVLNEEEQVAFRTQGERVVQSVIRTDEDVKSAKEHVINCLSGTDPCGCFKALAVLFLSIFRELCICIIDGVWDALCSFGNAIFTFFNGSGMKEKKIEPIDLFKDGDPLFNNSSE
jgi:hypothetical protein